MKLLFKQRAFSWLDSYDVYNEEGEVVYIVKGVFSIGHCLKVYSSDGVELGVVKEKAFSFLPKFYLTIGEQEYGCIYKEFSFFKPKFHMTCNDWQINGDIMEWDYEVIGDRTIMQAHKELFHFSDTYVLDIAEEKDALLCLMIVLAIDAAKCTNNAT